LIAPWAQSLVPETCRGAVLFASLVEDSVRRAKADFPLVPLCPVKSMAPVLAIAGHGGKGSRYDGPGSAHFRVASYSTALVTISGTLFPQIIRKNEQF